MESCNKVNSIGKNIVISLVLLCSITYMFGLKNIVKYTKKDVVQMWDKASDYDMDEEERYQIIKKIKDVVNKQKELINEKFEDEKLQLYIDTLKDLLYSKKDINEIDGSGLLIKFLKKYKDFDHFYGSPVENKAILRILKENKVNFNKGDPLIYVNREDLLKELLSLGTDIKKSNALHFIDDLDLVGFLIGYGADVNKIYNNKTPLEKALDDNKYKKAVEIFLNGGDFSKVYKIRPLLFYKFILLVFSEIDRFRRYDKDLDRIAMFVDVGLKNMGLKDVKFVNAIVDKFLALKMTPAKLSLKKVFKKYESIIDFGAFVNKYINNKKKMFELIELFPGIEKQIKVSKSLHKKNIKLIEKYIDEVRLRESVVHHITKVIPEFKEKYGDKKSFKEKKLIGIEKKFTQTEAWLTVFNGKKPENYSSLLDTVIGKYSAHYKKENFDKIKKLVEQMMKKERELKNYYVFYNAQIYEFKFLFDIQSEIRNWLGLRFNKLSEKKNIYLRLKAPNVNYLSAKDFIRYSSNVRFKGGKWDDNIVFVTKEILSENLSIFGNFLDKGESSFYYFLQAKSRNFQLSTKLLLSIFDDFNFNKKFYKKLKNEMFPLEGSKGNMLQIFIPAFKVDKFVYISEAFGTPVKEYQDALKYLEKYTNDPFSLVNLYGFENSAINKNQARIVLLSDFFNPEAGIKIFSYNFLTKKEKGKKRKILKELVDEMMRDWIISGKYKKWSKNIDIERKKIQEALLSEKNVPKKVVLRKKLEELIDMSRLTFLLEKVEKGFESRK